MTGKAADDDANEEIASELNRIADLVRQGPTDPAELAQLSARVETMAKLILELSDVEPTMAQRLEQLAQQLRNPPLRKNGSN